MLTGYWPPTNEMLRKFSTDPNQNPGSWQGANWEGRGYNIYAFFPEFPGGTSSNPKGNGDFEIDYQDVGSWQPPSAPTGDFWRLTSQVHPVAIMSYGEGAGPWEIEYNARNLPSSTWTNDYLSPLKPTPAPPDTTQASGYVRHSSLPMEAIAEAVNSSGLGINAWVDWDVDPGHFLCEYMAYHDTWYQSLHSDPCDQYYCVAAGFTHLDVSISSNATAGVEAALRALINHLDSQLVQYTISGTVTAGGSPLSGVTMCGLPSNPVTDAIGSYSIQVGGGWSGAVTPLKTGYTFNSSQRIYRNVRANQSAQDYTASVTTADTIVFDAASNTSSAAAGTSLSWSHTVGSGNNRVLVIGIVTKDSIAADQIISSVKFNGVNMTPVSGSTKSRTVYSGTSYSSTLRTDLYYMLNPPVGTYTVLITYNGSVSYRAGGAISLNNIKQQTPEAIVANSATSASISTNINIPNTGAWIIDVVGHSNSGSFTSSTSTERWDKNSGSHTGAGATKAVTSAGSNTMSWTFSGSSGAIVHSLAAFAPSETASSPPGQASSPNPANLATNVGITNDLSWSAGSNATSHDVYFGTSSPGTSHGNQTGTTFDTGTMSNNTTYYWRIDEVGAGGTTTGTVWSFTTIVAAPGQAATPNPANSATNVGITNDLSWTAGSNATSHDVYFGTSSPGTPQGNQTGTTFDTGTMNYGATYYWRIDEKNAGGTTTGNVWSFTTGVLVPNVVGSTQADANSAVTGASLVVGNITPSYSNTVPAGSVISENPSAGTQVALGSSVDMVVSLGKPAVPDVVGKTEAVAASDITAVDSLIVGTVTQSYSDTVASGLVISQSPAATTLVNIGSSVDMVVSLGPLVKDDFNDNRRGAMWRFSNESSGTTVVEDANKLSLMSVSEGALAPSCVGNWRMNDNATNTTVIDSSGKGNNGTAQQNTENLHTTGKIDGALSFNGTSDYVDVGSVIGTGAYTKIAWVKRDAGDYYNNIISSSVSSHHLWAPYTLSFRLAAGHYGSWYAVQDSVPLDVDTWYFVAVTYDPAVNSGRMVLYKNGQWVNTAIGVTAPTGGTNTYIGRFDNGFGFKGDIDNVMIFNRALTAGEISALYNEAAGTEIIPADRHSSDYAANGWTFDGSKDFTAKIDFHNNKTSDRDNWIGITIGDNNNYASISVGSDGGNSYFYYETIVDGNVVSEKESRTASDGTLYISYDADFNSLYLSHIDYGSGNAYLWQTISNPLQIEWTSPVSVSVGGGCEGVILSDGDAYLDNFEVSDGTLAGWPVASDIDDNGFIDWLDVLAMSNNWLDSGPGIEGDVNNDGVVDFTDFVKLAIGW